MQNILRTIYQERASRPETLGVLIIEKTLHAIPTTDSFDAILLLIVERGQQEVLIKHYTYKDKKAALHIITERQLKKWVLLGENRRIVDWIMSGKILFDRNEYIEDLKKELRDFPFYGRKVKMGLEFAKLIRRYMEGKAFFEHQQYMDAYNHMVHSLHHLARLAVIEHGIYPEVTVWNQVKKIEPEIYKLYEELINSDESMDKRLELLFLASEFLIHSRTNIGANHLLVLMEEKEYWSFDEMMSHEELAQYSIDLNVLLEYLIERGLVKVIARETKGQYVYHRYYTTSKELF